jgi:hypothetical protein
MGGYVNMKEIILQDVLDYILKCKDNDKLVAINDAIKDKFKTNASYLKYKLMPGDKVRVSGSNKIEKGTIHKVNRTRAIVNVGDMKWNVPFTMLTKEV